MVAYMIAGQSAMAAAQRAGQGNIVGELITSLAQQLGLITTHNATDVSQAVTAQTTKTSAVITGESTRLAVQATAGATGLAVQLATQKASSIGDAGKAAAGAYASASDIPYVGWAIAPAVALAAYSGAISYAAQGYEVPNFAGEYPAILHPNESVLPANIAQGFRNIIANQSGGGGGNGGTVNVTHNISAIDSKSFSSVLDENHKSVANAVAKARRGGRRGYG
jgi:hypothetical protein